MQGRSRHGCCSYSLSTKENGEAVSPKHRATKKRIACTYSRPSSSYRYRRESIAVYNSCSSASHQYRMRGSDSSRSSTPVKGLMRSRRDRDVHPKCSSSCVRKLLLVCSIRLACDDSTSLRRYWQSSASSSLWRWWMH